MAKNEIAVDVLETETPKGKINKNVGTSVIPTKKDLEWLWSEDAMTHLDKDNLQIVSSKYDEKREPKVQEGLKALLDLEISGEKINPLIILLGKYWEHKPLRKEIKEMIDAEAEEKGYSPADYLQNVLGSQIDKFADFQTAIDRIKYARTYFIPRGGIKQVINTRQIKIKNDLYNVPLIQYNEAKEKYPDYLTDKKQKDALQKEVIGFSELVLPIEEI